MPTIVAASDADWVRDHVRAALCGPGFEVIHVERGHDVRKAVADRHPDLVIVDLQIGNMGGMAVCLDLRLEESAGRLPRVPVLMLLDRQADVFLAKRSGAEGWIVKPLDAIRVRLAVTAILGGGAYAEGAERVLG
jgi:DNA-binding response OmpR family regulator